MAGTKQATGGWDSGSHFDRIESRGYDLLHGGKMFQQTLAYAKVRLQGL